LANNVETVKKIDEYKIVPFRIRQSDEPEWLYDLRLRGWKYFHDSPMPYRALHLWRYSDPRDFISKNHNEIQTDNSVLAQLIRNIDEQTVRGLIVQDLNKAVIENQELVDGYLGKLVTPEFGKFEGFNAAYWSHGVFIYIPDNTTCEKPIVIRRDNTESIEFGRLLVVAGNNVNVSITDEYSDSNENINVNNVVEIFAGDNTTLNYFNIQNGGDKLNSFFTKRASIGRDTVFNAFYGGFGGAKIKADTGVILNGRGANSNVKGVLFSNGKQQMDYHTKHHHNAGDSFSDLDFKVILSDNSRTAYTGLIRIEKEAANCEAFQENRNLLLNKGTKAESIPELEILTDQVRCSHGATMGPIDPEMVFYLKSRGFSTNEAVRAIVGGFVESTLNNTPDDFKVIVNSIVDKKLSSEN